MPYNSDPSGVALDIPDWRQLADYRRASPGQWFYGVLNTSNGRVYIVPGDVHDDPRNALQQNDRMLNTYASKPPGPTGGWGSLERSGNYERFNGIDSTPTGHMAVLRLMGIPQDDQDAFLGFRLIKTNSWIAQFSDRSNSLNDPKPDKRIVDVQTSPKGWQPSRTARMPPQWADALLAFLQRRLNIRAVARDF